MEERRDQEPRRQDEVSDDPLFGEEPLPPEESGSVLFSSDPAGEPAPPPPSPPQPEAPPPSPAAPPAQPRPSEQPTVWQQPPAPAPPRAAPTPPQPHVPTAPPPYAPPAPPPPPAWMPAPFQRPRGPHGELMFGDAELASWGSRVGAWLIDSVLALLPWAIAIVIAASGNGAVDTIALVMVGFATLWTYFLYFPLFMMRAGERNGQTPGKQLVGIRVVRDNHQPLGYWYSLLRELVVRDLLIWTIGGFFFLVPILDALWPLWDDTNRALHDMVVSTHVVRADQPPAGIGIP